MPQGKRRKTSYRLHGGVNQKTSKYTLSESQVSDLYNMDFNVPNALVKRPGSTQMVTTGTSGTIRSLYEFEKLSGASYLVCGSNNEINIRNGTTGFSSISTGWTNGQPEVMKAFVDKLWIANGQYMQSWDGTSVYDYGLPTAKNGLGDALISTAGAFSVFGVTTEAFTGNQDTGKKAMAVFAYSYVRADGYYGPLNFVNGSDGFTNCGIPTPSSSLDGLSWRGRGSGDYGNSVSLPLIGFTVPTNSNITAIALYVAMDYFTNAPELVKYNGSLTSGWSPRTDFVDPSRFYLFTLLPKGTTSYDIHSYSGGWTQLTQNNAQFSGMLFDFFSTYTPKYFDISQDRLMLSGFSNAPSVTFFTEVGAPEHILSTSFFETRTDDGDRVTGIKLFQDETLIFKRNSFHKLIGDNADNYQLVEITSEYGCLSNKSIAEYHNRLLFLDEKGIVEYNGADYRIISTLVEPVFRRMNISAALEKAVAVHHDFRNQIWFGIPVDGSNTNNLTVVYDYILDAWTFFDGFSPASFAMAKQELSHSHFWRGDYSGMIHYHSPSFYGDNGTGITCLIDGKFDAPDGENVENMFRRLFLDINTASGITGVVDVEVYKNYSRSSAQATFAIYQNQHQTRRDFGVPGRSIAFRMSHNSASLPLEIYGYTVQRRFLREV